MTTTRTRRRHKRDERGAALLTALLVMLLMAAVTAGFTALVITDTRVRGLDSTRTQVFYAVHAGLEQLTSDLGNLFASNVAPTAAQINALTGNAPNIGVTWQQPDGTSGYRVTFPVDGGGNPQATVMTVQNGPFQGLVGLATPYQMAVTGRLADGSEASLTRTLQTVAIPVFQFGIFSENDLSFFAGPPFNFGGRVHSNSNVFLASDDDDVVNGGLTLSDRVTAVGDIVRTHLSNGYAANGTSYTGRVRAITAPGAFRNLAQSEGSLVGMLGSADTANWNDISTNIYNHNIMNGDTGARRLDLPITQFGAGPIGLIQRPVAGENANILAERFYSLASLRILLSDTAAEIANLPGVTATQPVHLVLSDAVGGTGQTQLIAAGQYALDTNANTTRVPFGRAPAVGGGSLVPQDTPLIGGWIKIEKQTGPGAWVDVTREILNLGINSPQLHSDAVGTMAYNAGAAGVIDCPDWTPNAIIRLQRMWDVNGSANCNTRADAVNNPGINTAARRYSPLALYDPREGSVRDVEPLSPTLGGTMFYVELDARNLARWFRNQIPAANCPIACTGGNAWNVNGYTVYFSDRRGNKNVVGVETGEYGWEDVVNVGAAGTPNAPTMEVGEDVNGSNALDVYGATPRWPDGVAAWPGGPFTAAATPYTASGGLAIARRNPPFFFRRALKLTRGADLAGAAPGLTGLTIASENPVYIQGNWNENNGDFNNGAHVATAVLADAVTLLSNQFNDRSSFVNAEAGELTNRNAVTTWYRLAIIAGKGRSFTQPAGTANDYGTDGGAHNFLRYIEDWGGQTLNYRGSIASLYFSRQATGTYKCCTIVYSPPTRGYNFDTEFLTPALLPPRTPMFRDVNITGFAQLIRP